MNKILNLSLRPRVAFSDKALKSVVASKLRISPSEIRKLNIQKRSIDARKHKVIVHLSLEAVFGKVPVSPSEFFPPYKNVSGSSEVLIIGTGPAGLFAALRLIELGMKPILIERGVDIHERKMDIAKLVREKKIDGDSNYCFGEGGAGTFSDGKLYTRSKKRGDVDKILRVLHFHGAQEEILFDAHPHIGSDRLPSVIENIRKSIIDHGGEIRFGCRLTDMVLSSGKIKEAVLQTGERIPVRELILATGHSARDIYLLLSQKGILLEEKSFALGVRVEHPQELINSIQYHNDDQMAYLPSAEYRLSTRVEGRGVYSFCMCPGGYIIPSMTSENEMVVNGMSSSGRNTPFANSGIVVEIGPGDWGRSEAGKKLHGLNFQMELERKAFEESGSQVMAPAQRLGDFLEGRFSGSLPANSYLAGLVSSPMHEWLPGIIQNPLKHAFLDFGKKMKGFLTKDAIITGLESRTSSPVRIPRDPQTLAHLQVNNLFPCGEGAGYSGGIVSSAIDGVRCAEAVFNKSRL
ncbi:MAG: FAD-dependent oxidoreductase [Bacteroidota bacterium]|nr:FAD-dependent oxidoreductase [Bacteroidota bacterium]